MTKSMGRQKRKSKKKIHNRRLLLIN